MHVHHVRGLWIVYEGKREQNLWRLCEKCFKNLTFFKNMRDVFELLAFQWFLKWKVKENLIKF